MWLEPLDPINSLSVPWTPPNNLSLSASGSHGQVIIMASPSIDSIQAAGFSPGCALGLSPSHTSHHLLHGCFHHPLIPGVLLISYLCNLIFFPCILAPSPLGYEGRMQGKKMRTKDGRKENEDRGIKGTVICALEYS